MALPPIESMTGDVNLPDIGQLSYNGVIFSYMFKSRITGRVQADEAQRVTKFIGYTLAVEGVVTADDSGNSDNIMDDLRDALTVQGGILNYTLRGFGTFTVSSAPLRGSQPDVAWGPVPHLLEFSPLGSGRSAFVRWEVEVHYTQVKPASGGILRSLGQGNLNLGPVLQFNWEYSLRYDEDHYLSYRVEGTLEIPLTFSVADDRAVLATVDDFRSRWLDMSVDLERFRVTDRTFTVARDKRICTWSFACEQLKPGGIPPGCSTARGTFSCRNSLGSIGGRSNGKLSFISWQCSLRVTYSVRNDQDQRVAFLAFYSLLWWRMQQSRFGSEPVLDPKSATAADIAGATAAAQLLKNLRPPAGAAAAGDNAVALWDKIYDAAQIVGKSRAPKSIILTDFGFDEGLYLDSDKHTFHATWILFTNFQSLLAATGFTQFQPGSAGTRGNLWRQSMVNVVGWRGPLAGRLNSNTDVIVDIGGGTPWNS